MLWRCSWVSFIFDEFFKSLKKYLVSCLNRFLLLHVCYQLVSWWFVTRILIQILPSFICLEFIKKYIFWENLLILRVEQLTDVQKCNKVVFGLKNWLFSWVRDFPEKITNMIRKTEISEDQQRNTWGFRYECR